ncbi:sensor histidine kinase [Vagococcus bubulae]|uniref:histidine kinase n=1 Tax=Vagococcus bubulae TaxID=1977868 RepID=A0A429ZQ75_9ENTE|nr:sensor histidine kinase [Vagococcus bubulae]RST95831.1 hypothetical protein CBF36_01300 [Vagococcus bubulae]
MKKFLYQYLKDRMGYYLFVILISMMFLVTFFLYDLPIMAFKDGLLFVVFILLIWEVIDMRQTYKKHQALHQLINQETIDNQLYQNVTVGNGLIEEDYQTLLKKISDDNQRLEHELSSEQRKLLDYYGMWSHQIKTPLAALQVLIETDPTATTKIKNEISTIDGYLSMMLHYLKMTNLQDDLVLKSVALEDVVKKVIKKYRMFFIQKELSVTLESFQKEIVTDEKWLVFILEQIVFNSIKYTKTGGISIYLSGETLIIQDSGIGILPQDLPRIFESGYTGFNGRQHQKATGLGLHMSQNVANQLGINLEIESEVGKGTSVFITFSQYESTYD